jgi:hypothetical protein
MNTTRPHEDSFVTALSGTLSRHLWRSFTPRLLARMVLAQWDRHAVERLLDDVPGASAGAWSEVTPAPVGDPRADALEAHLAARRWKHLTASALGRQLLPLLDDAPG